MSPSLRAAAALAVIAGSGCSVHRELVPDVPPAWTPPPGAVPVALLSDSVQKRWDVYVNDQFVCSTPCKRRLDPGQPVVLHPHGLDWGEEMRVPNLFPAAREGPVALHVTRPNEALQKAGFVPAIVGVVPSILGGLLTPFVCGYVLSQGQDRVPCYALAAVTGTSLVLYGVGVGLTLAGEPKPAVTPSRRYLKGGAD